MTSTEDTIISAMLSWSDSQETDSPQEVAVVRHRIRSAIEAAIAQPVQPTSNPVELHQIKTAQPAPQRLWVGLTDEDMGFLFPHGSTAWVKETVKIVEAKLKEKNQ